MKKSGKTWDDVLEPRANFNDIDKKAISIFLKACNNAGRLPESDGLTTSELFEKLRLTENGKLKRAAIILFGKDPGKFYPNMFVKIGRFGKDDADLKFQEIIEGNLIHMLHEILNQLNRKFLIKAIEFEGIYRIEKGEYPVPAIREMLLNSLVHRSYMGAPIQIRVYDTKITIWNEGTLPDGLTLDALKRSHSSRPRNPIIADVCFKGGYIDSWGRGTVKIFDTCKQAALPLPEMIEIDGGFSITLYKETISPEKHSETILNKRQKKAVSFLKKKEKITNKEYQEMNNTTERTATRDLLDLVEKGVIKSSGIKGAGAYYTLTNNNAIITP
jgi:ATP-dependent DNA helicase RecG